VIGLKKLKRSWWYGDPVAFPFEDEHGILQWICGYLKPKKIVHYDQVKACVGTSSMLIPYKRLWECPQCGHITETTPGCIFIDDGLGFRCSFCKSSLTVTITAGSGERIGGMNKLQQEVATWSESIFGRPKDRERRLLLHLKKEVAELEKAIDLQDPAKAAEEVADCTLLLFVIADIHESSLEAEVRRKLQVNKARKWGPPGPDDGVREHVRTDEVGSEMNG